MATPDEESRKLLCANCGKHHGTFTTEGLGIKCRHCKETTTVPYRIKNLQDATAFAQLQRGEARRSKSRPPSVPKSGHRDVRKSGR
jgi:hypothetical protein